MSKRVREMLESIKDVGGKVWDSMEHPAAHGAHEMAAALFNGSAFVMYPRQTEVEDPQHGLPQEAQMEQDRGGMEM